jgi:hypothetical protein
MKKIDVKLIVICILTLGIIGLVFRGPEIKEVEKIVEVEKEVIVTDTLEVEVPYEVINEVYYETIKEVEKLVTIHDTIQVEKLVNVPVEVIKEVEKIVEVERPKTNDWYLGMGYDFGINPLFSGAGTRILYKTKNDIMFGGELGFRNNITNFETMEGITKPYIGGVVYIKLNK